MITGADPALHSLGRTSTAGVNMGLMKMEQAFTLEHALQVANAISAGRRTRTSLSPTIRPHRLDDRGAHSRVGFDGRLPTSWADGSHRWDGYLTPEEYPRIVDPSGSRIWTANARVVSGEWLEKLGDGGYDLGARAQQIRDNLLAAEHAGEADMLRIQLHDDRAVFLERWQKLLLDTLLERRPVAADPRRRELPQIRG